MADADLSRRRFIGGSTAVAAAAVSVAATSAIGMTGAWSGRLSSDESDIGFVKWQKLIRDGYRVHVYLDGVEVEHAEAADSVEGWVRRAKLDSDGHIYTLDDHSIARETVRGDVRIFFVKVA